jgi:hypothetical protein
MTKLLEEVVADVRTLPAEEQDRVADEKIAPTTMPREMSATERMEELYRAER